MCHNLYVMQQGLQCGALADDLMLGLLLDHGLGDLVLVFGARLQVAD